jgi:hypothetical protein
MSQERQIGMMSNDVFVCHYLMTQQLLDDTFRGPYPNVMRHFMTCIAQPEFNSVIGEASFIDKAPLPPKQEKSKKEGKPKKEGKKGVKKEVEEAPVAKKEEKKAVSTTTCLPVSLLGRRGGMSDL